MAGRSIYKDKVNDDMQTVGATEEFSQSQLALLHTLCGPVLALLTTCLFYAIIQQTVTAALNF